MHIFLTFPSHNLFKDLQLAGLSRDTINEGFAYFDLFWVAAQEKKKKRKRGVFRERRFLFISLQKLQLWFNWQCAEIVRNSCSLGKSLMLEWRISWVLHTVNFWSRTSTKNLVFKSRICFHPCYKLLPWTIPALLEVPKLCSLFEFAFLSVPGVAPLEESCAEVPPGRGWNAGAAAIPVPCRALLSPGLNSAHLDFTQLLWRIPQQIQSFWCWDFFIFSYFFNLLLIFIIFYYYFMGFLCSEDYFMVFLSSEDEVRQTSQPWVWHSSAFGNSMWEWPQRSPEGLNFTGREKQLAALNSPRKCFQVIYLLFATQISDGARKNR